MDERDSESASLGCIVYVLLAGVAANYLIMTVFGKNIHFLGDLAIGAIAGEILIPLAIIVWILKITNVI